MFKNVVFLVLVTISMVFLASCSEDKQEGKADVNVQEDIPYKDINLIYTEAVDLLAAGERMVSIEENQGKSACLNHFKENNSKARKLQKVIDTHYPDDYVILRSSFGHLLNCTSCLNSRDQCEVARDLLEEANDLRKFSSK